MLAQGWRIKSTRLDRHFRLAALHRAVRLDVVLLFGIEEKGALRVASAKRELEPRPGWLVIVLVPPPGADELESSEQRRERGPRGTAHARISSRLVLDRHAAACRVNCASSVEPVSAVVEDWPCWIAWVTASK